MPFHGYGNGYPKTDSPIWVDDNTWTCRRHCPSARFPANTEKCLYGCPGIVRPPMDQRPSVKAARAEAETTVPLQLVPAPVAKKPNKPRKRDLNKPRVLSEADHILFAGIPEAEAQGHKRQGRTAKVYCCVCGDAVFRRKIEVARSKTGKFLCTVHRRSRAPVG